MAGCFATPGEPADVAFDVSPDGERVVFSSTDGDLFLFNMQTKGVVQLTSTEAVESTPAFSPDGKSVIYAAEADGSPGSLLSVCSLDGSNVRQLTTSAGTSDSMPAFSPDGTQIVFARAHQHRRYSMGGWTWDDWDIYVMNADGENLRRVTQQTYYGVTAPKVSQDGQSIIYSADVMRSGGDWMTTLFEVDVHDTEPPQELFGIPQTVGNGIGTWASQPDVSPDGVSHVFVSDRLAPYHYDLFLMQRDGSKPSPLGVTSISQYNQCPVFAEDGKHILFLTATAWDPTSRPIFSLWQVDTERKHTRCIADAGLFSDPLEWKPQPN